VKLLAYYSLLLIVFTGCAGSSNHGEPESERRWGSYRFRTEDMFGEGTILFSSEGNEQSFVIYSPFGRKMYELIRAEETIVVRNPEGLESIEQAATPAYIPSLLENRSLSYGELFTLLSGTPPDFIADELESCSDEDTLSLEDGLLTVDIRRGRVKETVYISDLITIEMGRRRGELFRSVRLDTGDKNYFLVEYE
jgi:hypothetical protein